MKLLLAMAGSKCCSHRFHSPQVVVQVLQLLQGSRRPLAGCCQAGQAGAAVAGAGTRGCAGAPENEAAVLDEQDELQQQQQEKQAAASTQPTEQVDDPAAAASEATWELLLTVCQAHDSVLEGFKQFAGMQQAICLCRYTSSCCLLWLGTRAV
jgi:hypothetical protein